MIVARLTHGSLPTHLNMCVSIRCRLHITLTNNKQSPGTSVYGRIVEIFTPSETSAESAVAVLDLFGLKTSRHPIFGMPVLSRLSDNSSYLIVHVEVSQPMTHSQINE